MNTDTIFLLRRRHCLSALRNHKRHRSAAHAPAHRRNDRHHRRHRASAKSPRQDPPQRPLGDHQLQRKQPPSHLRKSCAGGENRSRRQPRAHPLRQNAAHAALPNLTAAQPRCPRPGDCLRPARAPAALKEDYAMPHDSSNPLLPFIDRLWKIWKSNRK